jgi:hypothetical protein
MIGRKEVCSNLIGGVSKVYLMDFVKYPKQRIELNADKTQLLSFPITIIYEVELRTDTAYDQQLNNEEGSISYEQSIELALKKDSVQTLREVRTLAKKDLRLIVQDRNGHLQIMGLYNGVRLSSYNRVTGGAKGDFNGYNVTFEAQEPMISPFIGSLNDVGFIEEPEPSKSFFRADNNVITADNNTISIDTITI